MKNQMSADIVVCLSIGILFHFISLHKHKFYNNGNFLLIVKVNANNLIKFI